MSENGGEEENTRRITLGKIIAYPVGVILLLSALGALVGGNVLSGVLWIVGGLIALPVIRVKLRKDQGISLSRWATVLIVFILIVGGGGAFEDVDTDSASTPGPDQVETTQTPSPTAKPDNLIDSPPETLLPTIDDFDAGWRELSSDDWGANHTGFLNTETDTLVEFDVIIHDSISAAKETHQQRLADVRKRGLSTSEFGAGSNGFLYQVGENYVVVNFRVKNVAARVRFSGGTVLTPQSNAKKFARLLHDTIVK